MASAYLYPGQGSQSVGMGQALATASPQAATIWEQADEALGEPLSRLAWEGPADQLDLTVNAQPALLSASVAAQRALEASPAGDRLGRPRFCAGHSMGQVSAMVAAGVLDLGDALRLVRERGRLMQASAEDGAMAAIIGLPDERTGERAAVEAAAAAARGLGARRSIMLPVSVAAHSPLMARAAEGMREALAAMTFRDPAVPLLANADAALLDSGEACRAELIEHLTRGVDWVAAVERMAADGVTTFVEVGPGKVLCGLVRRISPHATTIAIDDITAPGGIELPDDPSAKE